MPYIYRDDVLEQLAGHGVRPRPTTRPAVVMEFVNDLYRYEIRRLKERLLRKEFPQHEYFGRVVVLRRKYPLVSVLVQRWMAPESEPPDAQPFCPQPAGPRRTNPC